MFTNTKVESVINAPPQLPDNGTSTESGVWGLISKASVLWGAQGGLAGHRCPEERALSWADGSTVTAPHRGGKRFPFSSFSCYRPCRAGQGGVRCGAVAGGYGGGVGGRRRCGGDRHVTTHTCTDTYTCLGMDTLMHAH